VGVPHRSAQVARPEQAGVLQRPPDRDRGGCWPADRTGETPAATGRSRGLRRGGSSVT
jgi:hypothetical protein